MKHNVVNASIVGVTLTGISYFVGALFELTTIEYMKSWIGILEIFSVLTSYVCTILFGWQLRHAYTTGVITTAAYSLLFWLTGSYSLALFNLYLVFSLAYGWWYWGPDKNAAHVTRVTSSELPIYITIGVLVFGLLLGINWAIDGSTLFTLNYVDVSLAVMSGIAQLLLDRKKLENWWIWIVINLISIPYFLSIGLTFVAFQYIFFLVHAFYAKWLWANKGAKCNV